MQMTLEEIISKYKSQFQKEGVAEEIKEAIQNVSYTEYETYYKNIYRNFINSEFIMPNFENSDLKDINNYFYNIQINDFFDKENCIFNDSDDFNTDFQYFKQINESEFIKSLLDEKAEHGVRDDGHLLSSILGSICQIKHYLQNDFNNIDMYATTWWKLNTTHPFKNGNKRTSFIGVKSKMFSDILFNFVTLTINGNKLTTTELFNSDEFEKGYLPKMIKQIKYWKKPTLDNAVKFSKEFLNDFEENAWGEVLENEKIMFLINNVLSDISKSISKQISNDYILSIFIAKIKSSEYKKDDEFIKNKVLEILKADLIISIMTNYNYVDDRISVIKDELIKILEGFGPKRFIKEITVKLKKGEI